MDVILDAHTTNLPVPVEDVLVDVFTQLRRLQVRLNDETAEIDLEIISINIDKNDAVRLTPGSTVITEPAGRWALTRRYLNM